MTATPFVLPADAGIHGGVTAVGTALTSSGSVVEGVPTRAPPWIPHRGAVRRLGGGYRLGGRKDGCHPRLTGENRYPWWGNGGGDCPYVERVCSRRGPHPGPTMDTASGCGMTVGGWVPAWGGAVRRGRGVVEGVPARALPWIPHRGAVRRGRGGYRLGGRKDGCHLVLPVKTGIHGGVTAVGTAPTSSGFVAEGVPTRAPTMGYRIGVRYDEGGVGTGLGGGKTAATSSYR